MPLLPPVVPWPTTALIKDHVAEARHVYGTGGFLEILAFRIGEVASILPLHIFFRAPSRYSCSSCWCGARTSFVVTGYWSPSRSSALSSEPLPPCPTTSPPAWGSRCPAELAFPSTDLLPS